jgi:predicted O-methyltransferase YrrM
MIFANEVASAVTENECKALAKAAEGKVVLEVGSHLGRSTIALASTAKIVHAVDWHRGDAHAGFGWTLDKFVANLNMYGVLDKVVIHVGRFEDVYLAMSRAFSFAFLDSFHDRGTVDMHMRMIDSLLVPRGVIAMHDYMQPTFMKDVHNGAGDWLRWSQRAWDGPVMVDSTAFWTEKPAL